MIICLLYLHSNDFLNIYFSHVCYLPFSLNSYLPFFRLFLFFSLPFYLFIYLFIHLYYFYPSILRNSFSRDVLALVFISFSSLLSYFIILFSHSSFSVFANIFFFILSLFFYDWVHFSSPCVQIIYIFLQRLRTT